MFFKIGLNEDSTFPVRVRLTDSFWLNADDGWQIIDLPNLRIIFKGHTSVASPSLAEIESIAKSVTIHREGNYLAIVVTNNTIQITTGSTGGTPMCFIDETEIQNIVQTNSQIPTNTVITIDEDNLFSFETTSIKPVDTSPLTKEQVIFEIDKLVSSRIRIFFANNDLPVNIFVSGGVDTTLLWSYLRKLEIPHTLWLSEHFDQYDFYDLYKDEIRNHWAYWQIHYWNTPNIFGYWG
jgi:hypothetical protein